jgi:putative protease
LLDEVRVFAGEDAGGAAEVVAGHSPELRLLCRTLDQVRSVAEMGVRRIYVDFHDIRQYADAVGVARANGCELYIASVRIQKPGERGLMKVLTRREADGFLVRNLAALDYFHAAGLSVVGDFSLNVVNPISAGWLIERGCRQVTPSYDLNREQLLELVDSMEASRLEVVLHQHMPMFHMEHCVFCSVLSPGTNKTNCGRPCDDHVVELRDRVGMEHPLHADVACRNTLYNAVPQSGAEAFAELAGRGVGAVRVELLGETGAELRRVVAAYQDLIAGRVTGGEVWRILKASNRVGVTRGTLEAARNPLAII